MTYLLPSLTYILPKCRTKQLKKLSLKQILRQSEIVLSPKYIVEDLVLFQTAPNELQFWKLDMQMFLGIIYSTLYVKYLQGGRERGE